MAEWSRLVRYISAKDGATRYGDAIVSDGDDIESLVELCRLEVIVLEESPNVHPLHMKRTNKHDIVRKLLSPLDRRDVPIIRACGLNYKTHLDELGLRYPPYPTMFFKPNDTVADPYDDVPIPKLGQAKCDYEGELVIVIGKDAKDVSEEDALNYVAGYAACNDVSARDWQMDADHAGTEAQWDFSKGFDKYCPFGPVIVNSKILGDAKGLRLTTTVNGEVRQQADTSDLLFDVRQIVSHFSQGTTIRQGTLILTGTTGGVGLGMKPPQFLKDDDEVCVSIEKIGRVRQTMKFL